MDKKCKICTKRRVIMLGMLLKLTEGAEYTCGGTGVYFDAKFPNIVSMIVTIIQIAVPVLLIIFGMLDLGKAVMAQKEDEIKKGQNTFVKRIIAAAIVFFVIFVVKLVVGIVANDKNVTSCIQCFISAENSDNACKAR